MLNSFFPYFASTCGREAEERPRVRGEEGERKEERGGREEVR